MAINGIFPITGDPLWYKDALIYQLHVKSFFDSTGDGIGDFGGLTLKLDYLESLGINAVWLLPFYPSPLKDDGYDISEYFGIHPYYGTLRDFKNFLKEAHRRNIRVITELVLNHTSDQHDWFKRSRQASPGSFWREFYVWSDTSDKYKDARVIFKDFETSNWTWDPVGKAYFWHRFYSHQPDLNFENLHVHTALFKVIDYWLELGVDGVRLDAVPYLYEQEGTNCENLPQTFAFLKKLRAHVDADFKDRMLLAEANQWPEDAAAYFGSGDMCHMAFHFPLMPRMFMALRKEDRFPITDILEQTPPIPDTAQWAIFLRNHDELTLEMVTDEERDFMYRSYANDPRERINLGIRRRLAPLLQNSRRRMELMNVLLFSLPGTPIVYYGDEIGMGDNHFLGDRDGVRTPMQWSADRNAGFSRANPQQIYLPLVIDPEYNYESVNVENEERNSSSLLWWMRRVIAMRRKCQAFARGTLEFMQSDNASVLTFIRTFGDETVFVVINLSRYPQVVSVDLKAFAGFTPYDMWSTNKFPRISETPYVLTMGLHDYFWLALRKEKSADLQSETYRLPEFTVSGRWLDLFDGSIDELLETSVLPAYLQQRTTAGCKPLPITEVRISDRIPIEDGAFSAILLLVKVSYVSAEPDTIILPFSADLEDQVNRVIGEDKGLIMAMLTGAVQGLLYDCAYHPQLNSVLLHIPISQWKFHGKGGSISGVGNSALRKLFKETPSLPLPVNVVKAGIRKTSLSYGSKVLFKLFRRLEEGMNPDIELHRHLSATDPGAAPVARYFGMLEYVAPHGPDIQLGIFTSYVHNTGTAWNQAVDAVTLFFEEMLARGGSPDAANTQGQQGFLAKTADPAEMPGVAFGRFLETANFIGKYSAQLHKGLSAGAGPDFAPEPFTIFYQRSIFQSMRNSTKLCFGALRGALNRVSDDVRADVIPIMEKEKEIISRYGSLLKRKLTCQRSRIHGDFHLGQFITVGNGHVIMDLEGSSDDTLNDRRLKRSVLRDVAGMIYSFHRAACYSLLSQVRVQRKEIQSLEPWADVWSDAMAQGFLGSYLESMSGSMLLPQSRDDVVYMVAMFCLDRAFGELNACVKEGKASAALPAMVLRKLVDLINRTPS